MTGDDVRAWEHFLLGVNPSSKLVVDGTFDDSVVSETKRFQRNVGYTGRNVDGVVGPLTMGRAMTLGFDPLFDDSTFEDGPNWPVKPDGVEPMSPAERANVFGQFSFKPSPSASNPEGIVITDGWARENIVTIELPQLGSVAGRPKKCLVECHKLVAQQLKSLFEHWEREGLMKLVLTWNGMWVPRFVRGSRTSLSNHSLGTAFDINYQWNMLGTRGALKGHRGSVRELMLIAVEHGWFSGGWYKGRKDFMHLEVYKIT